MTIATVYRHRENKERDGQTERDKSRLIFFLDAIYSVNVFISSVVRIISAYNMDYDSLHTITQIGYSHDQLTWLARKPGRNVSPNPPSGRCPKSGLGAKSPLWGQNLFFTC